jgi:hypothetical protein
LVSVYAEVSQQWLSIDGGNRSPYYVHCTGNLYFLYRSTISNTCSKLYLSKDGTTLTLDFFPNARPQQNVNDLELVSTTL